MKIRKNTTISEAILHRAEKLMAARGFDDYSEFISALVREEWERRNVVNVAELVEALPIAADKPATEPYGANEKPAKTPGNVKAIAAGIVNKRAADYKRSRNQ